MRLLFFFSSRRRHTRSKRDWSSDVCSSDLSCNRPPTWARCSTTCAATTPRSPASSEREAAALSPPSPRRHLLVVDDRSEERRVGKECRSRGPQASSKEKKNETSAERVAQLM